MGILAKMFGAEEEPVNINWRARAESLQKQLDDLQLELSREQKRNRVREELLLDQALKAAGLQPIREKAEKIADVSGTEKAKNAQLLKKLREEKAETLETEKDAFIQSSMQSGKTKEEAEQYWDENEADILAGV